MHRYPWIALLLSERFFSFHLLVRKIPFFLHIKTKETVYVDGAEQSLPLEEIILFCLHSFKQLVHPCLKLIGWDKLQPAQQVPCGIFGIPIGTVFFVQHHVRVAGLR